MSSKRTREGQDYTKPQRATKGYRYLNGEYRGAVLRESFHPWAEFGLQMAGDEADFGAAMSDLFRTYSDLPIKGVHREKKRKLFGDIAKIFEDTGTVMEKPEKAVEEKIKVRMPVDEMMELLDEISVSRGDYRKLRKVSHTLCNHVCRDYRHFNPTLTLNDSPPL